MKVTSPRTKICAMCKHWNGFTGGAYVKPRKGMMNIWEYDPEEKQICYKTHFIKKGWNSCNSWEQKY